jgi:hypothetical protein
MNPCTVEHRGTALGVPEQRAYTQMTEQQPMAKPSPKLTDIDAVLKEARNRRWRVERGKGYYKMWCPCPDKHMKTVHLTPSSPNYVRNLVGQLRRATCWDKEEQ